jgi:hypothetical protein
MSKKKNKKEKMQKMSVDELIKFKEQLEKANEVDKATTKKEKSAKVTESKDDNQTLLEIAEGIGVTEIKPTTNSNKKNDKKNLSIREMQNIVSGKKEPKGDNGRKLAYGYANNILAHFGLEIRLAV